MVDRREVLQLLVGAGGVWMAEGAGAAGMPGGEGEREKVVGIGGVFFRAKDPAALGRWYRDHLGIELTPTSKDAPVWRTEAGVTLFTPFPVETHYFGDAKQMWMVNFRVRNLDRMAQQLTAAGIAVKLYPADANGRFARLHDPEGNPIELWQPSS
jgi:glyoxylase I family protein